MIKPKGILFDLDGVILDTEGIYTRFWDEVERHYPTGIPDFSSVIKGSNLHEILFDHYPDASTRDAVTAMLVEFQRNMRYEYFSGVPEFICQIEALGIPACIVTSSDNDKMDAVYRQHPDFRSHFNAIVTGEMVSKAKPDPECFRLGAEKIGVDVKDCWIFEDSIKGLKAARSAGGVVIGVPTTNPLEVVEQLADVVIDGFEELQLKDLIK
ncbi:MAG: HAD family phosphatase [Bacteroidales bacterium]|nr:HAD family phosphatase [Candidatus Sodaliphilus aphodohippi]